MSTFVELLNSVKNEIRNETYGEDLFKKFNPLQPKYYKCNKSQLIIDSFTRLVNDEKINIVTSAQFFVKKNEEAKDCELERIGLIHLSANKINQNFIEHSKKIITTAIQFQKNPELHKDPNYIFNLYSTNSIEKIFETTGNILRLILKLGYNDKKYTKHDLNCLNLKELLNFYRKLSTKKNQSKIDFLNLSLKFINETFYQNEWSFNKSNEEAQELATTLLYYFQCIWDNYCFYVLSKDYFVLQDPIRLTFSQIIDTLDNQSDIQVIKILISLQN